MNSPPTFQPESHPEEQSVPGKHYIPAKEKTDIYSSNHVFRTCAYCRVSTDSEMQQISFSLQQEHYQNLARDHPNWDLRKVYADEGISGTSLKKRDQFNAMLAACLRGEFDLILTKSVSRFGRNLVHCVSLVRELKNHNPPIGVFFETDNLFTLSEDSELKLSILATLAQEESVKKSESMIWSLEQRFKTERLLMPECYGYTREKDAYGRYVKEARLQIVEEEAIVVRFIFDAFLAGYPVACIAEILTSSGIPTKSGNSGWSEGGIRYILSNERYCGNVLTWKTFTVDVLEHKKRRNRENRDQYLYENFHEAIISAEQFEAAQVLLANRKYRVQSYPRMFVIDSGIFRGYVPVNHHWMNDDPNSYYEASGSVQSLSIPQRVSRRQFSTFNLAGYQVVRGAFLLTRAECPCISVTPAQISFNSVCQRKFSVAIFSSSSIRVIVESPSVLVKLLILTVLHGAETKIAHTARRLSPANIFLLPFTRSWAGIRTITIGFAAAGLPAARNRLFSFRFQPPFLLPSSAAHLKRRKRVLSVTCPCALRNGVIASERNFTCMKSIIPSATPTT